MDQLMRTVKWIPCAMNICTGREIFDLGIQAYSKKRWRLIVSHRVVCQRCLGGLGGRSVGHGWQADGGRIAYRADGLQRHITGALGGPFIGLLEENGADQADDGVCIGKDADDIGTALDLAVLPLDRLGGMDFGAVLAWEIHIGQDVPLSGIHQGGEPWHLGAELVGDVAPLGRHWA